MLYPTMVSTLEKIDFHILEPKPTFNSKKATYRADLAGKKQGKKTYQ